MAKRNNHGGKRDGAGRPRKKRGELRKGSLDPLHVLSDIVDDKGADMRLRYEAAKTLAQYFYPRLSATQVDLGGEVDLIHRIENVIVSPENRDG